MYISGFSLYSLLMLKSAPKIRQHYFHLTIKNNISIVMWINFEIYLAKISVTWVLPGLVGGAGGGGGGMLFIGGGGGRMFPLGVAEIGGGGGGGGLILSGGGGMIISISGAGGGGGSKSSKGGSGKVTEYESGVGGGGSMLKEKRAILI